jgi:hypothetical protein
LSWNAQGPPGPSTLGDTHVIEQEVPVKSGEQFDFTLSCSSGEMATGGGAFFDIPHTQTALVGSIPVGSSLSSPPTGWKVRLQNLQPQVDPLIARVRVVCVPLG